MKDYTQYKCISVKCCLELSGVGMRLIQRNERRGGRKGFFVELLFVNLTPNTSIQQK